MKAGNVTFIQPRDRIHDSGRLRIELLDDEGAIVSHVEVSADEVADKDQSSAFETFAFNIEEAQRKPGYLESHPLDEGEHSRARIELEMSLDYSEWRFRQRKGRPRWAGLGDEAIREWRMHD